MDLLALECDDDDGEAFSPPPENSRQFVRTVDGEDEDEDNEVQLLLSECGNSVAVGPLASPCPPSVLLAAAVVEEVEEEEEEEEDVRETLKHKRDNSAAARLVKLTSADMPPLLLLLRQAARSPPRIQAVLTNGLRCDRDQNGQSAAALTTLTTTQTERDNSVFSDFGL